MEGYLYCLQILDLVGDVAPNVAEEGRLVAWWSIVWVYARGVAGS